MKGYILCFIISLLFSYIGERYLKKEKKFIGISMLLLSILTVCALAGLRSSKVGTDVENYALNQFWLYNNEKRSFFYVINTTGIEPLFSLLVLISTIFKDFHFTLFFIELACAMPIYIYAYKNRKEESLTFIIFIFLITMYARSFNLMRQSIAISLIVLSTYYFKIKKYKKTFLIYLISIMFHYSAVICIAIYFIMHILMNYKNEENKNRWMALIIFLALILTVFMDKILELIPTKYSFYIDSQYAVNSLSILSVVKKLFWVVISLSVVFRIKNNKSLRNEQKVYLMFLLLDLIMYFMSLKVSTFGRLGNYFLNISYFGLIPKIKYIFKQKLLANASIIIILVVFWYNMTVINNEADKTYPYASDVLDVLNDEGGEI